MDTQNTNEKEYFLLAKRVIKHLDFSDNSTNTGRPVIHLFAMRSFKGELECLRQFLATENPLKRMKIDFYFTLKVLFVLKIFKFLS